MNIQVEKEDIFNIGNIHCNNDGKLEIICSTDTRGVELILLRNILKCFGDEYKVVFEDDTDTCIVFETNLPYSIFFSCLKGYEAPDIRKHKKISGNGFVFGEWSARCTGKRFKVNNSGIKLIAKEDENLEKVIFDVEKKTVAVSVRNPTLSEKAPRIVDLSDATAFFEELRKEIESLLLKGSFNSVTPNADRTVFEVS